jgi:hypothetical protein
MLKKVMIICLALSFVLIGSIAFAGNGHGPGDGSGEGDRTGEHGPGDCSFISPDSSTILAGEDCDPIGDGPFGPKRPLGQRG